MSRRAQGGFTLMELMVVTLIISIIGAIGIPIFNAQRVSGRNAASQQILLEAVSAMRAYQADNDNFSDFVFSSTPQTMPYAPTLTAVSYDAMTGSCAAWLCSASSTANPRQLVIYTAAENASRANARTSVAVCNVGRGDRSYCVLNITESDPANFPGIAPGLYYGQSTPGQTSACDANGFPGSPSDSPVQAWCNIIERYPRSWNEG